MRFYMLMEKGGGPFIGPRGGKWADAQHTIPWKEYGKKEKKHTKSVQRRHSIVNLSPESKPEDLEPYLHTSPEKVINIKQGSGLFGNFLFFIHGEEDRPEDSYAMTAASRYVHVVKVDPEEILSASQIQYDDDYEKAQKIIEEVQEKFDVDEDVALELLSEDYSTVDYRDMDADHSWWLQHATARAAKAMGYKGVRVEDEQGVSVMLDMEGQQSEYMYDSKTSKFNKSLSTEEGSSTSLAENRAPGPGLGINYVIFPPAKSEGTGYTPSPNEMIQDVQEGQVGALHTCKEDYEFGERYSQVHPYIVPERATEAHGQAREGSEERKKRAEKEATDNVRRPKNKVEIS